MAKTVLGIQLTPDETLSVRLRKGWGRAIVEEVRRSPRSEAGGKSPAAPPPADTVVAALGADEVFRREVTLPFSDRRKLAQAAPLEAEDSLPLPLEEVVHDTLLLEKTLQGSRVMVAAAPVERVARLLAELRGEGVVPHAVEVEALALAHVARLVVPPGESAFVLDASERLCQALLLYEGQPDSFYAFSAGPSSPSLLQEVALVLARMATQGRAPRTLFLCGPSATTLDEEAWTEELKIPVRRLPFPSEQVTVKAEGSAPWPAWAVPLGLALRGNPTRASSVNLLQGSFLQARTAAPWRQVSAAAAGYAAVLLAGWGVAQWLEGAQLEAESRSLKEATRAAFQGALPEVRNVVSEVDQLRAKVAELEERDQGLSALSDPEASPVRILRELSARIPRDVQVKFRELSIDREHVRIEGTTTSFSESDRIKAVVAKAFPGFASVTSDAKDGEKAGEVLFSLGLSKPRKGQG